MPETATSQIPTSPTLDIQKYQEVSEALSSNAATLTATGQNLLDRGIHSDEDYQAALELSNQAAGLEAQHIANFEPLCSGLFKLHKFAVGLRKKYAEPCEKLKDKLRAAAKVWYLEMQAAKKAQEAELTKVVQQQQRSLAQEAQDLIDQGYVKEGRAKLLQAQTTSAIQLPDAVPQVANTRVTPKYTGTCTDVIALMKCIVEGHLDLMWEVRGEMRPLVVIDQVVLNAIMDRMGAGFKCPGITVQEDVRFGAKKL